MSQIVSDRFFVTCWTENSILYLKRRGFIFYIKDRRCAFKAWMMITPKVDRFDRILPAYRAFPILHFNVYNLSNKLITRFRICKLYWFPSEFWVIYSDTAWNLAHHAHKSASLFLFLSTTSCHCETFHFISFKRSLATFTNLVFFPSTSRMQSLSSIILEVIMSHYRFTKLKLKNFFKS